MGECAGDGLFLHKDVSAGTVVSFYNGIRIMPGEIPPFRSDGYQIFLDWSPSNKYDWKIYQVNMIFCYSYFILRRVPTIYLKAFLFSIFIKKVNI